MAASDTGIEPIINGIQSTPVDFSRAIPYESLRGRVVLVTGGASGIGAAVSKALNLAGALVVVGDIDVDRGLAVVADLRRTSGNDAHHFVRVDVADWTSQLALFREAARLSPTKGIDAVVASAGINDSSESETLELLTGPDPALFADPDNSPPPPAPSLRTLNIDLIGSLYTTHLALAYLAKNPDSAKCSVDGPAEPDSDSNTSASKAHGATESTGAIHRARDRHLLLVSSIAGLAPLPVSSVYAAAKHGVVGLFRSVRLSAPVMHGVRVNLLAPQYVPTPIHGLRGAAVLVGVPKTHMDDVVETAMRLLADTSIVGRGVLVGTRATEDMVRTAGLNVPSNDTDTGADKGGETRTAIASHDIYAHDFQQADLLMRRSITLLNLATKVLPWLDIARDLYHLLFVALGALWAAVRSMLGLRPARRVRPR